MYERKNNAKLKDIADNLHLSIGTVQRALNNKGGYSEETRLRIIAEANRLGYIVNPAASALRRNPIYIGVVLPVRKGLRRYFFDYIWKGILLAENELNAQNIHFVKFESETGVEAYEKLLSSGSVKGLVTYTSTSRQSQELLDQFSHNGIPVFTVDGDPNINLARCGFTIRVPHQGNLAADILCRSIQKKDGTVLILGGSRKTSRQSNRSMDFCNELQILCPKVNVMEFHMSRNEKERENLLRDTLSTIPNIVGIFSTTTLETLTMCRIVKEVGMSGQIATIGMGIYEELLPYFKDNTLFATIYQNPEFQANMIIRNMVLNILDPGNKGKEIIVPASAVYKSVAADFVDTLMM